MKNEEKKDHDKSRKWQLTFNNPEKHGMDHESIKSVLLTIKSLAYWCMCDEIGEQGTYHTHLFIFRRSFIRFETVKNKFPMAHIEYCYGSTQDNRDYVRKEGKYKDTDKAETNLINTFEEYGECPIEEQGKRNDLNELYSMIKDGMSNYDILEVNPNYMLQIDKIERCRQTVREEEFKRMFRKLTVEYWYGDTGQGKTRTVMEHYGYENVYRVTNYKYPFDGYRGQDVIIFEEFYNSFKIQEMLTYLDGYPLDLPCRYNNKVACYTKVYILSNVAFDEQYRDVFREHPKTFEAFRRRINCIKKFTENGLVDYQNMEDYEHSRLMEGLEKENPFTSKEKYEQEILDLKRMERKKNDDNGSNSKGK